MNNLQHLLKLRGVTMQKLAEAIGMSMHPVQKNVKGSRQTPHIQQKIAEFVGLPVEKCFGPTSSRPLRTLIRREIRKKRGEYERELKRKVLPAVILASVQPAVND